MPIWRPRQARSAPLPARRVSATGPGDRASSAQRAGQRNAQHSWRVCSVSCAARHQPAGHSTSVAQSFLPVIDDGFLGAAAALRPAVQAGSLSRLHSDNADPGEGGLREAAGAIQLGQEADAERGRGRAARGHAGAERGAGRQQVRAHARPLAAVACAPHRVRVGRGTWRWTPAGPRPCAAIGCRCLRPS